MSPDFAPATAKRLSNPSPSPTSPKRSAAPSASRCPVKARFGPVSNSTSAAAMLSDADESVCSVTTALVETNSVSTSISSINSSVGSSSSSSCSSGEDTSWMARGWSERTLSNAITMTSVMWNTMLLSQPMTEMPQPDMATERAADGEIADAQTGGARQVLSPSRSCGGGGGHRTANGGGTGDTVEKSVRDMQYHWLRRKSHNSGRFVLARLAITPDRSVFAALTVKDLARPWAHKRRWSNRLSLAAAGPVRVRMEFPDIFCPRFLTKCLILIETRCRATP